MLRTATISLIFIILGLSAAADANHVALGVDMCSAAQVDVLEEYLRATVMAGRINEPSLYFQQCSVRISTHKNKHSYSALVSLCGAPCHVSFSTKHFEQHQVFHASNEEAYEMIDKCRAGMEAACPDVAKVQIPLDFIEDNHLTEEVQDALKIDESALSLTDSDFDFENYEDEPQTPKSLTHDAKDFSNTLKSLFGEKRAPRSDAEVDLDLSALYPEGAEETAKHEQLVEYRQEMAKETLKQPEQDVDLDTSALFEEDPDAELKPLFHDVDVSVDALLGESNDAVTRGTYDEQLDAFLKIQPAQETAFFNQEDGDDSHHISGGRNNCTFHDRMDFIAKLTVLSNNEVVKPVVTYDENIERCHKQIVAGMIYDVTLSFNAKKCPVKIWRKIDKSVQLMNAEAIMEDAECASYLNYKQYLHLKEAQDAGVSNE